MIRGTVEFSSQHIPADECLRPPLPRSLYAAVLVSNPSSDLVALGDVGACVFQNTCDFPLLHPSPLDSHPSCCMQVESDKSSLFYTLLEVPQRVVKHLHRLSQMGYDKLRNQLESQRDGGEQEQDSVEEGAEVCVCECLQVCVRGPA